MVFVLAFALAACDTKGKGELKDNIVDDSYDNYYEIFVYSFNDSNGDGYGDLNGVTEKLDYIRDMGYTGIWLMPINPSPSYHKYDVRDYKDVDPLYGTMEDFDRLLEKAHDLGIRVIIDFVANHTSSLHPWFIASRQAHLNKDTKNEYYDYYNWSTTSKDGYNKFRDLYYESRFDPDMPDLNLDCAGVREGLSDAIKFWMEKGVDGFRLDAVRYYYYGDTAKSVEFTGWIKEEAVKYNPDAYIVGEDWSSASEIGQFYTSGADSFFCFPTQGSSGYVNSAILDAFNRNNPKNAANSYFKSQSAIIELANGYIPAPFLCNHDTGRAAGFFVWDAARIKFGYGLLSMYTGNTFTYYGDEIGMIGSQNDPDKRVGMRWKADTEPIFPPGVTSYDPADFYIFDSVEEQLADENSILNYYKACNRVRNAFPALMRGTPERVECENENLLVFTKTYKEETVTIVINFSAEEETVSGIEGKLKQGLCVEGSVTASGSSLKLPKYSIAILA